MGNKPNWAFWGGRPSPEGAEGLGRRRGTWSSWVRVLGTALWFLCVRTVGGKGPDQRPETRTGLGLGRQGDPGHHRSCEDSQRSRGQGRVPRTCAPVLGAVGATGSPKRGPAPQAAAAVPEATPASAEAQEAQVTLRELQEALEEEVLTRQSLSRELEAIRTANQIFARSGSGRRVGLYCQQPVWLGSGRAHGLFLPAVSSVRPRHGTETWRRTSGSCRSGWSCCRPGETQASSSCVPFPEGDGGGRWARGVCGHLGEGEGPRLGHAAPPPSSVPPRALCLSLLLPAVTGVPSPRATDPPSHVRPLFFPCIKPAGPSADPALVSPSRFRDHPISGGSRRQTPSIQSHVYQLSLGPGLQPDPV